MVSFVIERPTSSLVPSFIRGSGGDDVLARDLIAIEQQAFDFFVDVQQADPFDVLDAIFLGQVNGLPEPDNSAFEGDQRFFGQGGNDYVADLSGNNYVSTENGNDRILLGDGNDRVFDGGGDNNITILGGNNTLTLDEGSDIIETGNGNDNIFDQGGNNVIFSPAGRNRITVDDGDDTITTGDGRDSINAFDGRNIVDAGAGNNIVRGGDGYDEFSVGIDDDFVEVRGGDDADTEIFDLPFIGISFEANNAVFDDGGSDNIRATAGTSSNGDDLVISDQAGIYGDDNIVLGAGDNLVVDLGGNDRVQTLGGDDTVFTSFLAPGDDDIDTGAGDDFINPGSGSDLVRGGPGLDDFDLELDGFDDTLRYEPGDETFAALPTDTDSGTDVAIGFETAGGGTGGVDRIDVSEFAVGASMIQFFDTANFGLSVGAPDLDDFLIGFDTDANGAPNFFTTILADIDLGTVTLDNFIFGDEPMMMA